VTDMFHQIPRLRVLLSALLLSACAANQVAEQAKPPAGGGLVSRFDPEVAAQADAAAGELPESQPTSGRDRWQTDGLPLAPPEAEAEGPKGPTKFVYSGSGDFVADQAGPEAPPEKVVDGITLNFENTDLREVAKVILGDLLNLNYIMDPRVRGTATLYTSSPLAEDALLPTLETLLRMNGAALVHADGMYRVVPVANAVRGNVTPQLGDYSRPLPQGQTVQVVPLKYISVPEMSKILEPLAPEGSIIRADTLRNYLVLAGSGLEVQRLLETIQLFDVDWIEGLSVGFFPLEYIEVSEVMKQLDAVFGNAADGPLAGLLRLIPIESANALLVVTPRAEYLRKVEDWIGQLDNIGSAGGDVQRLYVYKVRNGEAEELAGILSDLFGGKSSGSKGKSASVAPGKTAAKLTSAGAEGAAAANTPARAAGGSTLDSGIKVVADTVNNSLLIMATPREYEIIFDALERLDIVPLQVVIEATIVEVELKGDFEFGLQWFFSTNHGRGYKSGSALISDRGGIGEGDNGGDTPDPGVFGPLAPGFSWTLVNSAMEVRAVLNALASDSLVNVLSSPSVMVLDNQSARIQVGDQVPIVTQQSQSTTGVSNVINSVQYRDTGVLLAVTPRVNPGGLVIMEVEQEVSRVSQQVSGGIDSPTIATRNITSSVAVQSGQVVVLGGLIRDEKSETDAGIPYLYKLPVIDWLFGQETKNTNRSELVVVLQPRVIADQMDAQKMVDDFRLRLRGLKGDFWGHQRAGRLNYEGVGKPQQ